MKIDWRRVARIAFRWSLHGAGWLLTRAGRLLQSGGAGLSAVGRVLTPAPPDLRRE